MQVAVGLYRIPLGHRPSLQSLRRLSALFGSFFGTAPMSDFSITFASGLWPQTFPDRSDTSLTIRGYGDLPVLEHRVSTHAQGLRLRGVQERLAVDVAHDVAFPFGPRGRHPGWVISELNGWPAFSPVNCFTCSLATTRT